MLNVSPDLSLPLEAVTGTFGILATKGSGKSNAAVVMAEEMYDAGVPWVAVDPKGDWYGIRSSGDGKGPGLPIVVFGGRHGDVPLEAGAGAMLAALVLEQRLTCVLDVSQFTKADTTRFLLAFGEYLFRHADDDGAEPLHLFLEEAHEYLPQQVTGDVAKLVGAWQRIVKQGRFKGLGATMVSQRSSSLNKDVLELVDTLVVLRTIGPRSRDAIKAWVRDQDVDESLLSSLPTLADGEAWVWSPGALRIMQRVQFRRRRTFDSGATPKVGQARRAPATLADVDLAAIKEQMAETIEKAKADDPKELRRRIAALERELAQIRAELPEPERIVERVEVPVLGPDAMNRLIAITDLAEDVRQLREDVGALIGQGMRKGLAESVQRAAEPVPTRRPEPRSRPEPRRPHVAAEGIKLGKAERLILTALAQHPTGRTKRQVALLTGYAVKGGSFTNSLSRLRTAGYIGGKGDLRITDEGLSALGGDWEPLPTGRALADYWIAQLGHAEGEILRVLMEAWPESLTKAEAALRTVSSKGEPYDPNGGGFNNSLSRLRTLELVEGKGEFRASDDLMGGE